MVTDIRILRSLMKTRPVLTHSSDMQIALCGSHAVQFDCDEAAYFFVSAYDTVPALLDTIDALRAENARLKNGALADAEAKAAALGKSIEVHQHTIATLERRLQVEVEARTELTHRAKRLLRVAADAQHQKQRADTLQVTLDAERRGR